MILREILKEAYELIYLVIRKRKNVWAQKKKKENFILNIL